MTFLKQKKGIAALAAVAVVALGSVGAYAVLHGSRVGNRLGDRWSASAIVLSSPPVTTLYPGGATVPVTVTVAPGSGNQFVGTVSGTVTTQGGCDGSWFTVAPVNDNAPVAGGGSPTADTTVQMNDSGTNQNACQGLTMAIAWLSN